MKIIVKAKPNAREEKVEQLDQPALTFAGAVAELPVYCVAVREAPVAGRANEAIARALARHFGLALSQVSLVSGQTSRRKVWEIDA